MMQKPATASGICVWSTVLGGFQLITVWQAAQFVLVCGCEGPSPVAIAPLWQVTQEPSASECWKCTSGRNEMVLWHSAQLFVLAMWVAVFGVALYCEPVM